MHDISSQQASERAFIFNAQALTDTGGTGPKKWTTSSLDLYPTPPMKHHP